MKLLLRLPVPWVFILAYLLGVCAGAVLPLHVFTSITPQVILALGAALFALGAIIAGWGWVSFYKARTTRVPG